MFKPSVGVLTPETRSGALVQPFDPLRSAMPSTRRFIVDRTLTCLDHVLIDKLIVVEPIGIEAR